MVADPELRRLRALVKHLEASLEAQQTYFMRDREFFEKRVYELTTERDTLRRALEEDLEAICAHLVGQYIREGRFRIENRDGKAIIHLVPRHAVAQ